MALLSHRAREATGEGTDSCSLIEGLFNPAGMLSMNYSQDDDWCALQPLMLWQGGAAELFAEE